MILIIEGTDLVGKSTIAEQCAASHGWPTVKIRWSLIGDVEAETRGMATATIELLVTTRPNVILIASTSRCGLTAKTCRTCPSSSPPSTA